MDDVRRDEAQHLDAKPSTAKPSGGIIIIIAIVIVISIIIISL